MEHKCLRDATLLLHPSHLDVEVSVPRHPLHGQSVAAHEPVKVGARLFRQARRVVAEEVARHELGARVRVQHGVE